MDGLEIRTPRAGERRVAQFLVWVTEQNGAEEEQARLSSA